MIPRSSPSNFEVCVADYSTRPKTNAIPGPSIQTNVRCKIQNFSLSFVRKILAYLLCEKFTEHLVFYSRLVKTVLFVRQILNLRIVFILGRRVSLNQEISLSSPSY
jgi:hypothetical protein